MIDDAIKIRMVAPAVALMNFIKTYWVLSSYDGLQHVQYIVPNGCAGIIFYRLGVVSMSGAGETNAALAGTTMQPIEILRKGQAVSPSFRRVLPRILPWSTRPSRTGIQHIGREHSLEDGRKHGINEINKKQSFIEIEPFRIRIKRC